MVDVASIKPARQEAAMAVAAVALGATVLGIGPILVRCSETGPQATALWRFVFALPALGLVWGVADRTPVPRPRLLALLGCAGLAFGADIAFWHESLQRTSVVNATLFSNMTPVIAALAGWFFLRERVRWGFALGAGVAGFGAAALSVSRAQTGLGSNLGDGLGLISAFWYAAYIVIMRLARRTIGPAPAMVVTTGAAILIVAPAALAFHETLLAHSFRGWMILLALGVLVHAGGQGMIAFGLGRLPIALSTVLLWLQPLAAAALSWLFFGEAVAPLGYFGASLMLAGIWIVQTRGAAQSALRQ